MSNKAALVAFHRQMFSDLETEIKENLGKVPASFQKYHNEYRNDFVQFKSTSSLKELLSRLMGCNIVYCGDYHTLRQAQLTNLALLKKIAAERKIVLAMELVYSNDQKVLDRYMDGEMAEAQFLQKIGYRENFGFDWDNYRPIFHFAREQRIPVIGIDFKGAKGKITLRRRDRMAAEVIARASIRNPDALVWVTIGDLHLARTHLPGYVAKTLAARSLRRRILIIHQNNESIFWRIARHGLRGETEIVKLNHKAYCIFNTPPWIKLHSYAAWLDTDLHRQMPSSMADEMQISEAMHRLIRALAAFLQLYNPSMLDVAVYGRNDETILREFSPGTLEYSFCKTKMDSNKSFILPDRRIIFVASNHLNSAAELASRYIHAFCSGYREKNPDTQNELVRRIAHHALGFLGSKLLNHHRRPPANAYLEALWHTGQFQDALSRNGNGRRGKTTLIRKWIEDAQYGIRPVEYLGAHAGERMYHELVSDRLRLSDIRKVFCDNFESANVVTDLMNRLLLNWPRILRKQRNDLLGLRMI